MRVLMLSQTFPPDNYTGAPLQAMYLSQALARLGVDVEVLTTRTAHSLPDTSETLGIKIHTLRYAPVPGLKAASRFAIAAIKAQGIHSWNILHGHALSPMVLGIALARDRSKLPMLVKPSLGGLHSEGEITRILHSPVAPILRRAARRIDRFAVLDDLVLADLHRLGIPDTRLVRIYNGVDVDRFRPARTGEKKEIRSAFGICAGQILLFCGQLTPRKGLPELLEAWSGMRANYPNIALVVVGDGPLANSVREQAAMSDGTIVYLGQRADITRVLRMSDVLVLPSRFESFGNVVLEALASGVPVASTPCGIAEQILVPGRNGWMIKHTDVIAIQQSLGEALAASKHWGDLAPACLQTAQEFTFERIAKRYLKIYQEMLTTHRVHAVL